MSGPVPEIAIVVPTYWTRAGGRPAPGDAVYDHPTPLDETGTLGRLLESLTLLDRSRFYVLIIVAVTSAEVEAAARLMVETIVSYTSGVRCLIISAEDIEHIARHADERLVEDLLGLTGYSRVRNLQLAIPLALGSTAIVAVDDDEVVTDPQFLDKATMALGSTIGGEPVQGIGGYYVQDDKGRILLDAGRESRNAPNIFDRKAAIMNAATEKLEAIPGRIVPTSFCFGGNMVFSPEIAAGVCFDPSITRGEDIDYLINARLAGFRYFMDKDLKILHLPPLGGSYRDIAYHKVVQDVLRFVYEREKLRCWKQLGASVEVKAAELDPYPGKFLGATLDNDAREVMTRIFAATSTEQRLSLGIGGNCEEFMAVAYERARHGVESYGGYQSGWRRLTTQLINDDDLSAWLGQRLNQVDSSQVSA